ncbi:cytochrome C [Rhodanobacter glycinis]|uniref:Cytochrome C n=1 Tax=Rhodanobacter glycinis TaxID=582702 RepID=A0A502FDI0_9GAMM|nr:c-type cytochrome [Rhodanobacter glycinis]TPG11660.1 cytochrome C [Rhodanobacter glycinis]TPG47488.1 cytochrome C [Rhodanobacter glycinis]
MRNLLIAALCLVAALPICAQTPVQPTRLGLCAACHGATGHASMPGVPNLAGQQLDYLRDALKQYRDGRRNIPVMRAALGPVSAAELDALARWYSAQSPQPQVQP